MPNSMKTAGGSDNLALQVTRPVRRAGLVEEQEPENPDENPPFPTYQADVRIHAFKDLLLAVDRDTDRVSPDAEAELVRHAIEATQTVFRALHHKVMVMGQGYMLQLPHADDAGFHKGQSAPVKTAPNILVIHKESDKATQLANVLVSTRHDQLTQ